MSHSAEELADIQVYENQEFLEKLYALFEEYNASIWMMEYDGIGQPECINFDFSNGQRVSVEERSSLDSESILQALKMISSSKVT